MKYKCHRSDPEEVLSEADKRAWDRIIDTLLKYFDTPEGTEFYDQFAGLMGRIEEAHKGEGLSDAENRALAFIRREQKKGRLPSVREVTKVVGYRSSRTGHKIMYTLRNNGLIE